MKNLLDIINEKLKIRKPIKQNRDKIIVKDKNELREVILDELDKYGEYLDLTHVDVSGVTDMSSLFDYTNDKFKMIKSINITGWDVSNVKTAASLFEDLDEVEEIIGFGDLQFVKNESFDNCFSGCHKLSYIENIENLKIYPPCQHLSFMFSLCDSLDELDLNKWDVSNITWFSGMFMTNKIKKLYIDKWNTSNAYSCSNMFYGCKNLTSLDLSSWDISGIKIIDKMFAFCENLSSIGNIKKWDISKCKDYSYFFYNCKKLTLDVTDWLFNDKAKKLSMFAGTNRKKLIRPNLR